MTSEERLIARGQMLMCLARERTGEYKDRFRWSPAQIQQAFGLTGYQYDRAVNAVPKPQRWTRTELAKAVLDFAVKHERWPTSAELDSPPLRRAAGLPARSTIARNFEGGWPQSPFASLVQFIVRETDLHRRLTPPLVLSIRNTTVRRHAMEKYGMERLLRDGGGELVQQDDCGKLWHLPSDNFRDSRAVYVEVVNASPEPNGTFAHYFLRVPPDVDTAREAVAWTFEEDEGSFEIAVAS